jgi:Rps23 Pro-64 3,4-dihydroxylase Tpa1-like proline 4-hydroxylase
MTLDRHQLAELIARRILEERDSLAKTWADSGPVRHCRVENLLPLEIAERIPSSFPTAESLMLRSSIRERKRVGIDLDHYDPLIGEILHAFQEPQTIEAVATVTGHTALHGDPSFYASGISVMGRGDFLNPHIDNSHDGDRRLYRVLNLLYYVSPHWDPEWGGTLELWDRTVHQAVQVHSSFNRLVLMETSDTSWHSVTKVEAAHNRYCVSNYLFSKESPTGAAYRHVTTFTGRPEESWKRLVLKIVDSVALNAVDRYMPSLAQRTKHRVRTPGQS